MKSFLKVFTVAALCMTLIANTVMVKDSNAIIGLIAKKKVVTVIGGIGLAGGGVTTLGFYVAMATSNPATLGDAIGIAVGGVMGMALGVVIGGIGLIILDDQQNVADIAFHRVDESRPELFAGLPLEKIQAYNDELEELNKIRTRIIASMPATGFAPEQAKDEWLKYQGTVSDAAFEAAGKLAAQFMNQLQVAQ